MRRRVWCSILVLAISLMMLPVPITFAQSSTGDKVVLNEDFTLKAGETLRGSLAIVGGRVILEQGSMVDGDTVLFGGQLTGNGVIAGSVAAFGGRIALGDSAVVEGDFASLGGTVVRAPGAVIRGETLTGLRSLNLDRLGIRVPGMYVRPPLDGATNVVGRFLSWQLRTFATALLLVILGVAALLVAPKGIGRIANAAATQPIVSLGIGLLTLLLALFAGALLLIACGLGLVLWLVLLLGLLLGWVCVGLWLGQRLLAALKVRTGSSIAEMVIGVFLITVLAALPFCVGFFSWLVLGSIGLGAVVLTRFGTQAGETGALPREVIPTPADLSGSSTTSPLALSGDATPEAPPGEIDPV